MLRLLLIGGTFHCIVHSLTFPTLHSPPIQKHTWYFSPTECSQYTLKAVLVSSIQTSALRESSGLQTRRKTVLSIHGLGAKGEITV